MHCCGEGMTTVRKTLHVGKTGSIQGSLHFLGVCLGTGTCSQTLSLLQSLQLVLSVEDSPGAEHALDGHSRKGREGDKADRHPLRSSYSRSGARALLASVRLLATCGYSSSSLVPGILTGNEEEKAHVGSEDMPDRMQQSRALYL